MISRQSETIFSLINEMTTLNNLQQNKKVINANIISYLRNLYECFVPMVETKQIDYIFSSNVSEIYLDYIPEYIRVIMHNLLNHAVTYCKEYTNITVSIHCDRKKNVTPLKLYTTELASIRKVFYMFLISTFL